MTDFVVCSPWEKRCVPSLRVRCMSCRKVLAMSHVVRAELPAAVAVCAPCAAKANPDAQPGLTPGVADELRSHGVEPDGMALPTLADLIRGGRPW